MVSNYLKILNSFFTFVNISIIVDYVAILHMLYHTICGPFHGEYLEPRTSVSRESINGKFLFASTNLLLSACYAIPNGGKHFCAVTENGSVILVIQKSVLENTDQLCATIFTLPTAPFRPLPDISEQFISASRIHRDKICEHIKISSLDDLMQLGIQIFLPSDHIDEFNEIDVEKAEEPEAYVMALLQDGKLRWLNQERFHGTYEHRLFEGNRLVAMTPQ